MPSAAILEKKKQLVSDLTEKRKEACAGVIVQYEGINVEDDTKLRRELREAGVEYRVIKNTYLRFALEGAGITGLDDVLEGTTAVATSKDDEIAAARVLCKYAETSDTFKVKAGFSDGKALTAETVTEMSKVPGKDALYAMLAGELSQCIAGLARALNAVAEQKGGEVPAEA